MNRLPFTKQVAVISALVEGNSIRATSRMTGVAKGTILSLLEDVGMACAEFHNRAVRNVKSHRIQCDEIWQFCYAKEKNVPTDKKGQFGYGDVWTWTAVDADTKLTISYLVGTRDAGSAYAFMQDLASRLASRIQLTTDGLKIYVDAVEDAFGSEIDYAIRASQTDSVRKLIIFAMAVALYAVHYNFCRIHQTLRVTSAMEAGLSTRIWEVADILGLITAHRDSDAA